MLLWANQQSETVQTSRSPAVELQWLVGDPTHKYTNYEHKQTSLCDLTYSDRAQIVMETATDSC